jgi:hypothetical protein
MLQEWRDTGDMPGMVLTNGAATSPGVEKASAK